jgi:Ca2+-dependent lipid-binding protein
MVHATLGPMMYHPNVYTLNLEQLLSGIPLDTAIGVLQVVLHSARGIKGIKIGGGTPDPYVSLSINNRAQLAKTKYKHNTFVTTSPYELFNSLISSLRYNPTWMETKFLLVNSLTESLVLSLYDYNDHRADTLLGSSLFDLASLRDDASREGIKSVVLMDGKERGELRFDVAFYPILGQNSDDVQELPKTSKVFPHLLDMAEPVIRCRYRAIGRASS